MNVEKLSVSDGFRFGVGLVLGIAVVSPCIALVSLLVAMMLSLAAIAIGG